MVGVGGILALVVFRRFISLVWGLCAWSLVFLGDSFLSSVVILHWRSKAASGPMIRDDYFLLQACKCGRWTGGLATSNPNISYNSTLLCTQ